MKTGIEQKLNFWASLHLIINKEYVIFSQYIMKMFSTSKK